MNSLQRLGREPRTSRSLRAAPTLKLWDEFLKAWPPDRVRGMSLEEYTNPHRNDAFIYWLEFRTKALGSIQGGDAIKFGIYRRKDKEPKPPERGRIYRDEYAWRAEYGDTAKEAFATVRSRLMEVIHAARTGDLAAIDDVDVGWPFVKWKVAFLYQDRDDPGILAIYKEDLLAARYEEAFPHAAKTPRRHEQHTALIEHYSWLGDALDISPEIWSGPKEPRYWLMALGQNANLWPACRESGIASMGYDDYRVDLGQYGSQEELGRAIGSESRRKLSTTRRALWEFSHVMAPRDVIFVKKGRRFVVGHGAVASPYRYVPNREEHRHLRDVDWKSNFPDGKRVRGKHLAIKTLTDITEDSEQVTALKVAVGLQEKPPGNPPSRSRSSRNLVFYGPPGTGKTYATAGRALAIIGGSGSKVSLSKEDRDRFSGLRFGNPRTAPAKGRIDMVTFHQNYAYEDFVEGIRPKLAEPNDRAGDAEPAEASTSSELGYELRPGIFRRVCEAAESERRAAAAEGREPERFVLIIDEINRGNIPKIFGELITLIEPSRRLGAEDETTVSLPYSGDEFGVPDNLYIIGTMNTADRSIQQLDTALRRRFTFVEMMPKPDHELIPESVDGVNCRELLRSMNERIAVLMDREHQIGHTYLFKVRDLDDLADRFRNRIFPLLQEYFYDDWRRIRAVLGNNAFVRERRLDDPVTRALADQFGHAEDDRVYERLSFSNDEWKNSEQYKRIYSSPKED